MMKKTIWMMASLALLGGISAQAMAALPPYYQGMREIAAIANSKAVAEKLAPQGVTASILRTDEGYKVVAGLCSVDVRIVALPSDVVGPTPFELQVGELTCQPRD